MNNNSTYNFIITFIDKFPAYFNVHNILKLIFHNNIDNNNNIESNIDNINNNNIESNIESNIDNINNNIDNINNNNIESNFITNINVFKNINDILHNLKTELISKNLSYKIDIKTFTRDYYYSQIRDKCELFSDKSQNIIDLEIIYTEDLNLLDKLTNKNKSILLFASDKIIQDKLSFINLSKYHFTLKINSTIIDIDNIKIIIENDIVFIEIKKNFDKILLYNILNIILNN